MQDPRWHIIIAQHQVISPGAFYHWSNPHRPGGSLILKLLRRGRLPLRLGNCWGEINPGEAWHFRHGDDSEYGFAKGPADQQLCLSWLSLAGAGCTEHWAWLSARAQGACPVGPDWQARFIKLIDEHLQCPHRRDQSSCLSALIDGYAQAQESDHSQSQGPLQQALLRLYEQPLTISGVQEIAEQAAVSREHFSRIFRQRYGQSPQSWLQEARLQHARRLLWSGGLSVAQVAAMSGFASAAVLARALRKHFGLGPQALRASPPSA